MRTVPALVLFLLLSTACSEAPGAAGPAETATPPSSPPIGAAPTGDLPSATLDAGPAGSLEGGAGTHCWTFQGAGRCVDFIGPVTNVDPVAVAPGQALTLDFEAGAPLELAVSWYEVAGARSEVNAGARVWHNVFERFIAPNLQPSGLSLDAPDRPGEYVLAVFSRWAMGDISYGFYLRVE